MISNNCNNFSMDGGIPPPPPPPKKKWTVDIMMRLRCTECGVPSFFRGIPPSTEKLLQSFLQSPCLSVYIVSAPYKPLNPLSDVGNISHNCYPWPKGLSWSWTKVIFLRSRSQCIHNQNLCLGHYSLMLCWIWKILPPVNEVIFFWGGGVYRNCPVCPSVCLHRVWAITSYSLVYDNISHNCCPWPKGVSWPWTKVKVTMQT